MPVWEKKLKNKGCKIILGKNKGYKIIYQNFKGWEIKIANFKGCEIIFGILKKSSGRGPEEKKSAP